MVSVAKAQVALVDDHPLFRQGLAMAVGCEPDLEVVGQAGNAREALDLARSRPIDIAVVDILMPSMSGISLASELHESQPDCKILGLSVIDEPGLIADMLRAHASGYAFKTQAMTEILDAIRQVLGGIRYLPPSAPRAASSWCRVVRTSAARPPRRSAPESCSAGCRAARRGPSLASSRSGSTAASNGR